MHSQSYTIAINYNHVVDSFPKEYSGTLESLNNHFKEVLFHAHIHDKTISKTPTSIKTFVLNLQRSYRIIDILKKTTIRLIK